MITAQQPAEPQQVKSRAEAQNSAEPKAPPPSAARPEPSKLATTSTLPPPASAAGLAEAPAVKETPSAQTLNDTMAVAPAPKPQSKKPRMMSRTTPRKDAPRNDDAQGYEGYFDGPRYGYEPQYGYEPRYGSGGSSAWASYY